MTRSRFVKSRKVRQPKYATRKKAASGSMAFDNSVIGIELAEEIQDTTLSSETHKIVTNCVESGLGDDEYDLDSGDEVTVSPSVDNTVKVVTHQATPTLKRLVQNEKTSRFVKSRYSPAQFTRNRKKTASSRSMTCDDTVFGIDNAEIIQDTTVSSEAPKIVANCVEIETSFDEIPRLTELVPCVKGKRRIILARNVQCDLSKSSKDLNLKRPKSLISGNEVTVCTSVVDVPSTLEIANRKANKRLVKNRLHKKRMQGQSVEAKTVERKRKPIILARKVNRSVPEPPQDIQADFSKTSIDKSTMVNVLPRPVVTTQIGQIAPVHELLHANHPQYNAMQSKYCENDFYDISINVFEYLQKYGNTPSVIEATKQATKVDQETFSRCLALRRKCCNKETTTYFHKNAGNPAEMGQPKFRNMITLTGERRFADIPREKSPRKCAFKIDKDIKRHLIEVKTDMINQLGYLPPWRWLHERVIEIIGKDKFPFSVDKMRTMYRKIEGDSEKGQLRKIRPRFKPVLKKPVKNVSTMVNGIVMTRTGHIAPVHELLQKNYPLYKPMPSSTEWRETDFYDISLNVFEYLQKYGMTPSVVEATEQATKMHHFTLRRCLSLRKKYCNKETTRYFHKNEKKSAGLMGQPKFRNSLTLTGERRFGHIPSIDRQKKQRLKVCDVDVEIKRQLIDIKKDMSEQLGYPPTMP